MTTNLSSLNMISPLNKCRQLVRSLLLTLLWLTTPVSAESLVTYYHTDMTGSPIAVSNEEGDLLWHEEYTDFGYRVPISGTDNDSVTNRVGFTGHLEEKVGDRQLVYAQQRYYDPILARFLSVDSASYEETLPQTVNRYAYGLNNPHRYTDPDGEFVFLIPVLAFVAKEVVAEAASVATNGATDFLSVRRMGTKLVKGGVKLVKNARRKRTNCSSLDGDTLVLTSRGYKAIKDIKAYHDQVLAKDDTTGAMGWKAVFAQLSNTYDHTVYITIEDESSEVVQTIVSNKTHPFFAVRESKSPLAKVSFQNENSLSTEGLLYQGDIHNGNWIDASKLISGDLLLNSDETWSIVNGVEIVRKPLQAFNLRVADYESYYVKGADTHANHAVWVHNCNLNNNDAVSNFGVYEIEVNDALHKVGKADLKRVTQKSGLPTRIHAQARKLEKKHGKGNVQATVVEDLGETTTKAAKAAEAARLQRIYDATKKVPGGNKKSFKPK